VKTPKKIKIEIQIRKGKFASNLNLVRDILKSFEGLTIDVTFAKRINKRSNRQNAYYWGVIIPIIQNAIRQEWGEIWNKEQTHEFLLTNHNYEELVNEETGEIVRKVRRSSSNNTVEQEEYHERIRVFAKEFFNTDIPFPNEQIDIEF